MSLPESGIYSLENSLLLFWRFETELHRWLVHHRLKCHASPLHAAEIPGYHRDDTDEPESRQ